MMRTPGEGSLAPVVSWLRSYALMVQWEILSLRILLPLMAVVQLFMGAGLVIGLGFLFEGITTRQALYLSSGSTVISILTIGMVMSPQLIAQQKMTKTYDFLFSLPVPRLALVLANLTVWMLVSLPGMAFALTAAALRYDLDLEVSPWIVAAVLLTALVAASVGYAFAHAIPNPGAIAVVSQILVFVIIMYSPINFPAERLPGWMMAVHDWLPFQHAANAVRGTLTEGLAHEVGRSIAILAGWTAGSWALTAWVLGRRR